MRVSCILRSGHTLLTSSLSPVGLVHWLHIATALIVASSGLEEAIGRTRTLALYVAAGAATDNYFYYYFNYGTLVSMYIDEDRDTSTGYRPFFNDAMGADWLITGNSVLL